jgi:hypothetical protein
MAMPRKHFTDSDRTLIWERWQRGESLHQIAQRLATRHSSIRQVLARTGGIRPPSRHRSARVLTLAEREEISRSVALGRSLRSIAAQLHRERPPPLVARSSATVGVSDIEPIEPTREPGIAPVAPSPASCAHIPCWPSG